MADLPEVIQVPTYHMTDLLDVEYKPFCKLTCKYHNAGDYTNVAHTLLCQKNIETVAIAIVAVFVK